MRALGFLKRDGLTPVYLAVVVLGSIVAHLASEFFAMGSEADAVALSPKHLYLAIAALACAAFAAARLIALGRKSTGMRDLKRELHLGLESLPWRGRGVRFYSLTAALQLIVGLGTQYGEGCPFCSHDVAAGIAGALFTVVLLAFAAWSINRRLPSLAAAIEALLVEPSGDQPATLATRIVNAPAATHFEWSPALYNRPPPFLSTSL